MSLILRLVEIFNTIDVPRRLDLEHYDEKQKKVDRRARVLFALVESFHDVKIYDEQTFNHMKDENKVEEANYYSFWLQTGSDKYSKMMAKLVRMSRVFGIDFCYEKDNLGGYSRNKTYNRHVEIQELMIYAVLQYFKERKINVIWRDDGFVCPDDLPCLDRAIINTACQAMKYNCMIANGVHLNYSVNIKELCDEFKVDKLMKLKDCNLALYKM